MSRPARHDVLFEPVAIGPVTTRNRFYQVAHCNGMGRAYPSPMAAMREVKAEGGWGVVCTEQCDIHPSSNHQRELRLWDEQDIPALARAVEGVHRHGALAAIELVHNGSHVGNLESRAVPLAPSPTPVRGILPISAREMDAGDIADLRLWHRAAARNARRAGFDVVHVYAGHDMSLPAHFLSRRHNRRTDGYGGSLANRARLLRELVEDTVEEVGDECAVALRFGVDAVPGLRGTPREEEVAEARAVVEMLADVPHLWDVGLADWDDDGATSRFSAEGRQEEPVRFVKQVTGRPVVGVGRFTSPDTMARMVTSGVLDLIGAARPSIADPFLPRKIELGRHEDIRECIGCNVSLGPVGGADPMHAEPHHGRGVAPRPAPRAHPGPGQRRPGPGGRRWTGGSGGGPGARTAWVPGGAHRARAIWADGSAWRAGCPGCPAGPGSPTGASGSCAGCARSPSCRAAT